MYDKICGCCKSELNLDDILYLRLSCGHEYHYDCIYDAFIYNRKRNTTVLECPYCRSKVEPIKEMDGFNFDVAIHKGIMSSTHSNWSKIHFGNKYCIFKSGELYCNKYYPFGHGNDSKYCSTHKNVEHYGEKYCHYFKGINFCNSRCVNNHKYCIKHLKYENSQECNHIFVKGARKGQMCKNITTNNNQLCDLHNKITIDQDKKTCCQILTKGKNKGNECGKKVFNDSDYCKTHFPTVNDCNTMTL